MHKEIYSTFSKVKKIKMKKKTLTLESTVEILYNTFCAHLYIICM